MRLVVLVSCAVLALAFPAATAQVVPNPMLKMDKLTLTPGAVLPGGTVQGSMEMARVCPSAAMVLDPQDAPLTISGKGSAPVTATFHFAQQVCAQQISQAQSVEFTVVVPASTPAGSNYSLQAHVSAPSTSPTTPAIPEQAILFTVGVLGPEQPTAGADAVMTPAPTRDSPAPVAPLLGLALLVGALRRR